MVLGTLIYSVVLGFFNDYTSILHTGSYSMTFAVAVVMQSLTYATLLLKDKDGGAGSGAEGRAAAEAAMLFSVWLIMFLSKFVFLGAIAVHLRRHGGDQRLRRTAPDHRLHDRRHRRVIGLGRDGDGHSGQSGRVLPNAQPGQRRRPEPDAAYPPDEHPPAARGRPKAARSDLRHGAGSRVGIRRRRPAARARASRNSRSGNGGSGAP